MIIRNLSETKQTKSALAEKLGISRGMLYYQHKRPEADEILKKDIEYVLKVHQSYGHKRIAMELGINKKRALRIMKKFHLMPLKRRGKRLVKPDDINKPATQFKNEIEHLCPIKINIVWVGDRKSVV